MRAINSKEVAERKARRNKLVVGIFFIVLLVFSTAGFALYDSDGSSNSETENGQYNGQYWVYSLGGQLFYFTAHKSEITNIEVNIQKTLAGYLGSNLYIDSENSLVASEINNNLARYSSRVQMACYGPCEYNLPEKDCSENMIIFRESAERKVYQTDNCVFIDGDIYAVDAFLYKILGI